MKRIALVILLLAGLAYQSNAQATAGKNTIYYLLDTLGTPATDRMWQVYTAKPHRFYTIKCPCLSANNLPVFRGNTDQIVPVAKSTIDKVNFASLPALIELVRKNDDEHFGEKFTIYFILKEGHTYSKQQVFFLGGKETKVQ